jgi:pimeloyl-ACP methyl ester carboxylesterase
VSPSGAFRNGTIPTVLLVHGAFTDGSIWAGVIPELQAAGIGVIAVANPLRTLASDAAYVGSVAAAIDGPVVLAGHCYGGAVITAAGAATANIAGLVYVAGYALEEGESPLDICDRFPGSQLLAALRPGTFSDGSGDPCVQLHIDHDLFPQLFAADLPRRTAAATAAAQRPIAATAFADKAAAAAWKTTPSWYVAATEDMIIPLEAQQFMARRAGSRNTEIRASHAITLTQPAAVAELIAAAAAASVRALTPADRQAAAQQARPGVSAGSARKEQHDHTEEPDDDQRA